MKRIRTDRLQPGDIVLTASQTIIGKGIRLTTRGLVSHAMICVQHGSIIDSTADGVQARNIQRELFKLDEEIFVFRLRISLNEVQLRNVVDFARSQIGARYSKSEALRSRFGRSKPRNKKQFCSRLVARSYAYVGINLVGDKDYCTPEDLRSSPLLFEVSDLTETVSDAELAAWRKRLNPIHAMHSSQNAILAAGRRLDASVENFSDLDRLVQQHPEWDAQIAKAYRDSGFLDIWRMDFEINPWHYNVDKMDAEYNKGLNNEIRQYCIETIREAYSGGIRFAVNLAHYRRSQLAAKRETTTLLINLYQQLVRNDELRRNTAIAWLQRRFPQDVELHLETIVPHSQEWFSIVDRVEPNLGVIARISIAHEKSADVCSSCGDPARDYRLINSSDTMPGVPTLRLCDDCVDSRRAVGEVLEPFT